MLKYHLKCLSHLLIVIVVPLLALNTVIWLLCSRAAENRLPGFPRWGLCKESSGYNTSTEIWSLPMFHLSEYSAAVFVIGAKLMANNKLQMAFLVEDLSQTMEDIANWKKMSGFRLLYLQWLTS